MRQLDEKRVGELSADLVFVSDSPDVDAIRDYIAQEGIEECDAFFVRVDDGDYIEVWAIQGIVPYNHKRAIRLI